MAKPSEAQELSLPAFWDNRYNSADLAENQPTHEWFRGFDSLNPWLSKHLFIERPANSAPMIMHLGCGDSVNTDFQFLYSILKSY